MKRLALRLTPFVATTAWAWPSAAFAHHALYGRIPNTFLEGFLSGLAHPLIEPLHFIAVLAVGVVSGVRKRPVSGVLAFVGATFLATWATGAAASGMMLELTIAVSVFLLGISILVQTPMRRSALIIGLFLVGAIHGAAYAEAILGAGTMPLAAYLLGLALVQGGIAVSIAVSVQLLRNQNPFRPIAGAIISGMGVFATMSLLVGAA